MGVEFRDFLLDQKYEGHESAGQSVDFYSVKNIDDISEGGLQACKGVRVHTWSLIY